MENKYKSQRCRKYRVHKVHTAAQLLKRETDGEGGGGGGDGVDVEVKCSQMHKLRRVWFQPVQLIDGHSCLDFACEGPTVPA